MKRYQLKRTDLAKAGYGIRDLHEEDTFRNFK